MDSTIIVVKLQIGICTLKGYYYFFSNGAKEYFCVQFEIIDVIVNCSELSLKTKQVKPHVNPTQFSFFLMVYVFNQISKDSTNILKLRLIKKNSLIKAGSAGDEQIISKLGTLKQTLNFC